MFKEPQEATGRKSEEEVTVFFLSCFKCTLECPMTNFSKCRRICQVSKFSNALRRKSVHVMTATLLS